MQKIMILQELEVPDVSTRTDELVVTETGTSMRLPPRVSYSQINTYQRCKFRFYLSYILGIKPRTTPLGLMRGGMLHNALDAYLFNQRSSREIPIKVIEQYAYDEIAKGADATACWNAAEEAKETINWYLDWADVNDDFTVVLPKGAKQCETSGEVPLVLRSGATKPLFFKIDTIIHQNGKLKFKENKFRKNLDSNGLEHDLQITLYQSAWNKLHPEHKLESVLYNIVGAKPRKDGMIAVRVEVAFTEAEQSVALRNAAAVVEDMEASLESMRWPMNVNKECGWDCSLLAVCMGMRSGNRLEDFLSTGMFVQERR